MQWIVTFAWGIVTFVQWIVTFPSRIVTLTGKPATLPYFPPRRLIQSMTSKPAIKIKAMMITIIQRKGRAGKTRFRKKMAATKRRTATGMSPEFC